jgi:ferric-dicitrate binding protein FerR (iron transport regulator)
MTIRGHLRLVWVCACTSMILLAGRASSAPGEWEAIRTGSTPRRITLTGQSYIDIARRSSANVMFHKASPSIHLSSGRLIANLYAESRMSARLSASQVFVRASDGLFFIANDSISNRTTIGVCRGTVTAFAGRGSAASNKNGASTAGEFSIEAGEQAIVTGDGTIVKEQDDSLDCSEI